MNIFIQKKYPHTQNQKGFTVIEMITVISIFGILTGILFFNYQGFQKNTDFSVFTQEFGLLLKKQQQNAMAGKLPDINPTNKTYPGTDWKPAYGLYFEKGANVNILEIYDVYNEPGEKYAYTINDGGFLGNCLTNPDDECFNSMSITNDREILGIYEGGYNVTGSVTPPSADNLSVIFERPYPDAHMRKNYQNFNPGGTNSQVVVQSVDIVFKDPGAVGLNVLTINPTGSISIRRAQ